MAKKKIIDESVVDTTTTPEAEVEATVIPEEETKPKRSRKKAVIDVAAEDIAAIDDKGETTPLVDLAPELKGETATVDTSVAVEPVAEVKEVKPTPAKKATKATNERNIKELAWLYPTSVAAKATKTITGKVYLCGEEVTGRYPVTNDPAKADNIENNIGWVDAKDLGL